MVSTRYETAAKSTIQSPYTPHEGARSLKFRHSSVMEAMEIEHHNKDQIQKENPQIHVSNDNK